MGERLQGGGSGPGTQKKIAVVLAGLALAAALARGMALLVPFRDAPAPPALAGVYLTFAWPEIQGRVDVAPGEELVTFAAALAAAEVRSLGPEEGVEPREVDGRLVLGWSDGTTSELAVTTANRVYDLARGEEYSGASLGAHVAALMQRLRESTFGELLTWEQVRPAFPVGGAARVRDLETGLSFEVVRHRGDAHADVEPRTAADSQTLKRIYGGTWSWKRRAVVITLGGRNIAGSMNGMPHGWGDIFDNEFVGHFCIHFWQSRVHGTWRVDPGHQLMVHKAAGRLRELLDHATPAELVQWAIAAVNHRDIVSLRYMAWPVYPPEEDVYSLSHRIARPVRHLTFIGAMERDPAGSGGVRRAGMRAGELSAAVEVQVTAYYHVPDPDQPHPKRFPVALHRDSPDAPWRVDLASLLPLATPGVPADALAALTAAAAGSEHSAPPCE